MAKAKSVYRCTECGHDHPKWAGRCEACGAWNTVAEEPVSVVRPASGRGRRTSTALVGGTKPARLRDVATEPLERWRTGLPEFDFVLGGGIVPGSMILIGGEPGIGKSTLLLQAAARLETAGRTVLYASGEESPDQFGSVPTASRKTQAPCTCSEKRASRPSSPPQARSRPTWSSSIPSRRSTPTHWKAPPAMSARSASVPVS